MTLHAGKVTDADMRCYILQTMLHMWAMFHMQKDDVTYLDNVTYAGSVTNAKVSQNFRRDIIQMVMTNCHITSLLENKYFDMWAMFHMQKDDVTYLDNVTYAGSVTNAKVSQNFRRDIIQMVMTNCHITSLLENKYFDMSLDENLRCSNMQTHLA